MLAVGYSPLQPFVEALFARDFLALEHSLAPGVAFRALYPRGVGEATSAAEARAFLDDWFGDAEHFEIVSTTFDSVGNRAHASYRVHIVQRGVAKECQQHLFADVGSRGIEKLDLLCSGFVTRRSG